MPEVPTKLDNTVVIEGTLLSCLQSLSSTFGAEAFYCSHFSLGTVISSIQLIRRFFSLSDTQVTFAKPWL
jgi:hypothetical protein